MSGDESERLITEVRSALESDRAVTIEGEAS